MAPDRFPALTVRCRSLSGGPHNSRSSCITAASRSVQSCAGSGFQASKRLPDSIVNQLSSASVEPRRGQGSCSWTHQQK